MFFSSR